MAEKSTGNKSIRSSQVKDLTIFDMIKQGKNIFSTIPDNNFVNSALIRLYLNKYAPVQQINRIDNVEDRTDPNIIMYADILIFIRNIYYP